jgi:hypothetical protein
VFRAEGNLQLRTAAAIRGEVQANDLILGQTDAFDKKKICSLEGVDSLKQLQKPIPLVLNTP